MKWKKNQEFGATYESLLDLCLNEKCIHCVKEVNAVLSKKNRKWVTLSITAVLLATMAF